MWFTVYIDNGSYDLCYNVCSDGGRRDYYYLRLQMVVVVTMNGGSTGWRK